MKKHNKLVGVIFLVVIMLILVACGNKQNEADKTVLNVTMALSEEEWDVMRNEIIPEFEKESGLTVNALQMEAGDVLKKLEAMAGADKVDIDVIAQDVNTTVNLVNKGLVADMTEFASIIPEDAIGKTKESGEFDGKTYFFPFRPNVEINYYNETKFKEFGIEPPTDWAELLAVAKRIKAEEDIGRVAFKFEMSRDVIELTEFIRSAGGDVLVLNDEGTATAFTFLQELWPYLSESSLTGTFSTTNGYLAKDEVYYMPNWPFATNIIVEDGGRTDIMAHQGFTGPERYVKTLGGDVLGVTEGSTLKAEAVEFIEYLQSDTVQTTLLEKNGWPSFRTSVGLVDAGWKQPYLEATLAALAVAEPLPNVPYWGDVNKIINDIFQEVVLDKQDVSASLEKYAEKLQRIQENY